MFDLVFVCKDVYVLNVIWFTVDIEIKNLFAAEDERISNTDCIYVCIILLIGIVYFSVLWGVY